MSEQTLVKRLRDRTNPSVTDVTFGVRDEAAARIEALEAEAKRFYLDDGSYEECELAEACLKKRKTATERIYELEVTVNAIAALARSTASAAKEEVGT